MTHILQSITAYKILDENQKHRRFLTISHLALIFSFSNLANSRRSWMIMSNFQINRRASPISTIPATTPATMGIISGPAGQSGKQRIMGKMMQQMSTSQTHFSSSIHIHTNIIQYICYVILPLKSLFKHLALFLYFITPVQAINNVNHVLHIITKKIILSQTVISFIINKCAWLLKDRKLF